MTMPEKSSKLISFLIIGAGLIGLFTTTFVNYLLFHTLAELISIVVAFSFFLITWNSRYYIRNQYLLFIGIAYLFIAFLDLLHTLSYKGMPIFTDYDYYANQLWIGARYLESLTLVFAFYFLAKERSFRPEVIFAVYALVTAILVASVFYWKTFPVCFVDGQGLTAFKKISEYVICGILFAGMLLLYRNRDRFDHDIFRLILLSMVCTVISELAFTFYVSNYGFSNLVGHYFKLFSFYLIYKAIIETGIRRPYELIFKELSVANADLATEVKARIQSEKKQEELIAELQTALAEVKTLSGLLPICSHCKKVRDDSGYWNSLDAYLEEHSDTTFSHSICRECAKRYYPDYDIYDD